MENSKENSKEENQKLVGYLEVPQIYWSNIRYGTHIRYYTKKDGFRPGGFVLKNPFDVQTEETKKRCIKLQNGFNTTIKTYQQWFIAYDDLSKIYMKPDASSLVIINSLEDAIEGLNGNIKKITSYVKSLEKRLSTLEKSN